jgi:hypothetical protein
VPDPGHAGHPYARDGKQLLQSSPLSTIRYEPALVPADRPPDTSSRAPSQWHNQKDGKSAGLAPSSPLVNSERRIAPSAVFRSSVSGIAASSAAVSSQSSLRHCKRRVDPHYSKAVPEELVQFDANT